MIEGVIIKKLEKYSDERGWLAELFREDEIKYKPVMSYISMTKPGVVRGPHEHVNQSDCFVFVGPGSFEVHLWGPSSADSASVATSAKGVVSEGKSDIEYMKLEVGEDNPCLIIVPPGVVHGYKCVSEVDALSINLPDKLYKGEGKKEEIDEIRWEDREGSPYKIS